ncbi:Patatin-like phospholipase [compost metagenome]
MLWRKSAACIWRCTYGLVLAAVVGCTSPGSGIQPLARSTESMPQDNLLYNDWMQYRRAGLTQLLDSKICTAGEKKSVFLVTLSGGGSRAAYFAARVLHELDKLEGPPLTSKIDGIFSVSGGSLAAALFALSKEPGTGGSDLPSRPVWTENLTDTVLGAPLVGTMAAQLAQPDNLGGYLFGSLTRTDLLQQAIEKKILANTGAPLTFRALNPARPPVFIMATNATTEGKDAFAPAPFGSVFIFAKPELTRLGVDMSTVRLSTAMAASAAFPGLLSPVTIPRYRLSDRETDKEKRRFVHLIDGGNSDNLGLLGVKRVLLEDQHRLLRNCESVVVLSVDAFGYQGSHHDDRFHESSPIGWFFDQKSALASFDALLAANRARLLAEFKSRTFMPPGNQELCAKDGLPDEVCGGGVRENWDEVNRMLKQKLFFVHLSFDSHELLNQTSLTRCAGAYGSPDPECEKKPVDGFRLYCERRALRERVAVIPTKFGLEEREQNDIATFVSLLNHPANRCFRQLGGIVDGSNRHDSRFYESATASCDETRSGNPSESWLRRGRMLGDVIRNDSTKKLPDIDESCARVLSSDPADGVKFLQDAKRKLLAQPKYLVP